MKPAPPKLPIELSVQQVHADVPIAHGKGIHFIVTVGFLVLLGGIMMLGVLFLRPQADLLVVLAAIGAFIATLSGIAKTYFTAEEAKEQTKITHLIVNSQLAEWKKDYGELARLVGRGQGVDEEQARTAAVTATAAGVAVEAATQAANVAATVAAVHAASAPPPVAQPIPVISNPVPVIPVVPPPVLAEGQGMLLVPEQTIVVEQKPETEIEAKKAKPKP